MQPYLPLFSFRRVKLALRSFGLSLVFFVAQLPASYYRFGGKSKKQILSLYKEDSLDMFSLFLDIFSFSKEYYFYIWGVVQCIIINVYTQIFLLYVVKTHFI